MLAELNQQGVSMPLDFIGLQEARELVARHTPLLPARPTPLSQLTGLVAGERITALVSSPSVTSSTKDGYAVKGADLKGASEQAPVRLKLIGSVAAGEKANMILAAGQAIKITTGAPLPKGADAVIAIEFTSEDNGQVLCRATAEPGRNVMPAGSDVAQGQVVCQAGSRLSPPMVGLLAAAGITTAPAHPRPKIGLLATGREVIAPGHPLPDGGVYASNLVALSASLSIFRMENRSQVVDDDTGQIIEGAAELLSDCDALITSGGAWTSGRDLVKDALAEMGMELIFWRVRMGPGKGVAFGLMDGKPVFCLPGGPPSNEMAFLQLALPGLLAMCGRRGTGLPLQHARLATRLTGQSDWTQLWHGSLERGPDPHHPPIFHPFEFSGRLQTMANSDAIAALPEGMTSLEPNADILVQRLAAG
jgi:molybdopterin molybdotransferase